MDDVGGRGACLSFNGGDAGLNLSLNGSPPGPFSLKMAVRPRAYGNNSYTDRSRPWMTTTPDGKIVYTRLAPNHA